MDRPRYRYRYRGRGQAGGMWTDDYAPAHAWLGDPGVGPVIGKGRRSRSERGRPVMVRIVLLLALGLMIALTIMR